MSAATAKVDSSCRFKRRGAIVSLKVLIHRTDIRSGHLAVHAADPLPKGVGESQWVAVGSHYPVLIVLKLVDASSSDSGDVPAQRKATGVLQPSRDSGELSEVGFGDGVEFTRAPGGMALYFGFVCACPSTSKPFARFSFAWLNERELPEAVKRMAAA